ncbi:MULTISPECIES: hypothetical protein [Paenibacillus]|uniref:hypothetical protein n=1 Tax=Paenibacillus TaxID=44249 RepID=UPI00038FDC1E|nr:MULTISPECIES: hypothetical protein [Paenibacillus]ASS67388.1 hypothetical protein CIC07_15500 [Paenibacillus sp. RUD330]KKC48158.1 hypothetical protein VE23_15350 [Paenibacillus sp. D9]CDN41967.1 hypothetical protein BN871_AR_00040 [Paenibacillus sp. P22]SIQ78964.1 hypothetical protein SAMN05880555_2335 [Paenibacillus sp. RU4X]SIR00383.1 hypothetical protein SAMN05880570_2334 [Paenibacillus sp. RU4T]
MSTWTLRYADGQDEQQPELVFQRQSELNDYIQSLTVSDVLRIRVYDADMRNMCGKTYVYHYLL